MERSAETTRDDPDGEYPKRNRWFESGSLQRRVRNELYGSAAMAPMSALGQVGAGQRTLKRAAAEGCSGGICRPGLNTFGGSIPFIPPALGLAL